MNLVAADVSPLHFLMSCLILATVLSTSAESPAAWKPLFNGRNLDGWDTYLAPPADSKTPLGWNNDPRDVFTVVDADAASAIRVSGEIYGSVTTRESFTNFHIRVEFKWGEKRWPPRANVGRDTGILYCCVKEPNPNTGWMTSVECNIMEKGIGQWWSVNGAIIDVEGLNVTKEMEPEVPYQKEGPGEKLIVYKRGAPRIVADPSYGVTPSFDEEKPRGEWNTVEVLFWAGQCIHLLNGRVNLVATYPRFTEASRVVPLRSGKLQLQSEGAECYYRKVEVRSIDEVPTEYLDLIPRAQDDEAGFKPLFGKNAAEGWAQCGPGHFTFEDGVATGHGGMGLWWYTRQTVTNFVLRGEFLQDQAIADSGVFVRFPNPGNDPWVAVRQGQEMEIGDPNPEKPTWRTGSIYPLKASVSANTKPPGQWNEYEMVCIEHDYSIRMNGRLVTTWSDPNRRSQSGYIGLQNYNDGKTVQHRNLRIKELP
ncbi:MAG: DUF1080 domain-containing protein [Verrucomicrobia bacterium]|nr:DUF1080 domain-containing protein [Verrucomicrobiota bacterium]